MFIVIFSVGGCGTAPQETELGGGNDDVEQSSQAAPSDQQAEEEADQSTDSDEETSSEKQNLKEQESEEKNGSTEQQTEDAPRDGPLSTLKVHYIDVGQADAALLEFDSYKILIDAGDWNSNNVVNYLNSQNISAIDIAIGTHPDADHIGQLDKVVNQFDVGEVWLSGNTSSSKTFQRVLSAIEANGVDYDEPRTGDVFDVGSLQIEVLHPSRITGKANQESISLKLTYGETEFIFTGDAEKQQEQSMMQSGIDLDADILQLGHHGSNTSTSQAFLEAVSPEVAIYSAGTDNSYGHPHVEVVNAVKNYGATLYGTDVHGTIIVTTNGVTYDVTTKADGTITPSSKGSTSSEQTNQSEQEPNSSPSTNNDGCVDVNSATMEDLQQIIHIGPARAEDLIQLRPYDSIDDLSSINGIGPSRIDDIKSEGIACIGG